MSEWLGLSPEEQARIQAKADKLLGELRVEMWKLVDKRLGMPHVWGGTQQPSEAGCSKELMRRYSDN